MGDRVRMKMREVKLEASEWQKEKGVEGKIGKR